MKPLPKRYAFLDSLAGSPRIFREFRAVYGTQELRGPASNPTILEWADAVDLERVYRDDATAWCGLAMAYVALQAGFAPLPVNPLGARNWLAWGNDAEAAPIEPGPALGDVLVFWRGKRSGWSGHVGIYVGEDATAFHVLGGNQSDAVTIARIQKDRLLGARRCAWRINQPAGVRKIELSATGALSTNEA